MRLKARKDTTQAPIVRRLRQLGVTVVISNQAGWPDLACWTPDTGIRFWEAKTGKGTLTPHQERFPLPYGILRTPDDVMAFYAPRVVPESTSSRGEPV